MKATNRCEINLCPFSIQDSHLVRFVDCIKIPETQKEQKGGQAGRKRGVKESQEGESKS